MPACHAGGRGFESRPDRLRPTELLFLKVKLGFFVFRAKKKKCFEHESGQVAKEKILLHLPACHPQRVGDGFESRPDR